MALAHSERTAPALRRVVYDQGVLASLRELVSRWELLRGLVVRDLKVRYRGSLLGFFWSLLTPLAEMLVLTFVIKFAMRQSIPNLSVQILVGLVVWTFFFNGWLDACDCILNNRDLVRKIYFPRPALPLAGVLGNLLHLLLSTVVLLVWLLAAVPGYVPSVHAWWLLPVLVVQVLWVAGLGLMLAAAHTFYRDIKFILMQLLRLLFFASPIMYPASLLADKPLGAALPAWALRLYLYNPVAAVVEAWRAALLGHQAPDLTYLGPVAAAGLVVFAVGYHLYLKAAWRFPEAI